MTWHLAQHPHQASKHRFYSTSVQQTLAFIPPLAPPGAPVEAVGPYSPPLATSGGAAASEDGALLSFLLRRVGLTRKEALALMALELPEEDEGGGGQRGHGQDE